MGDQSGSYMEKETLGVDRVVGVVLTAGLENGDMPDKEGMIRANLALENLANNTLDCIYIAGGARCPDGTRSFAQVYGTYLQRKCADEGIDPGKIIVIDGGGETSQDIELTAEYISQENTSQHTTAWVQVYTSGFHLGRAQRLFEQYGILASPMQTEKTNDLPKAFLASMKRRELAIRAIMLADYIPGIRWGTRFIRWLARNK